MSIVAFKVCLPSAMQNMKPRLSVPGGSSLVRISVSPDRDQGVGGWEQVAMAQEGQEYSPEHPPGLSVMAVTVIRTS